MSEHTEMRSATPTPPNACSAATRMRYHRERRREGLRCITIELRETKIDELIRRKLLQADARNELNAVAQALYHHLDATLGAST